MVSAAMPVRSETTERSLQNQPYGLARGKRHREPPPSMHGAKHSDTTIAKSMLAQLNRHKAHG